MTHALREHPGPSEFEEFQLPEQKEKVTHGIGEAAALATVTVLRPEITAEASSSPEDLASRPLNVIDTADLNSSSRYVSMQEVWKKEGRKDPLQHIFDQFK